MRGIPVSDHAKISALLTKGLTLRATAEATGYSYNQVRAAVDTYRLRKVPAMPGQSPFTRKQKARMVDLALERVRQGFTVPAIAKEIEQRTGKRIAPSSVRLWIPDDMTDLVRANAERQKVIENRKRSREIKDRVRKLEERIAWLEAENTRLRARLERTTT